MKKHFLMIRVLTLALVCLMVVGATQAQGPEPGKSADPGQPEANLGTGFTYQGQLRQGGISYTGTCDFIFSVWNSLSGTTGQQGSNQTVTAVPVTNGLFTVQLNAGNEFNSAFDGKALWLQSAVRCPAGGTGLYTTLSPRQPLTAAPYALSLMPGALVKRTGTGTAFTGEGASGTGVRGASDSGYGIYGTSGTLITLDASVGVAGAGLDYGVYGAGKVGVRGHSSSGVALLATGGGVISSTAETILQVSPLNAQEVFAESDAGVDGRLHYNEDGSVTIYSGETTTQTYHVLVPFEVPSKLYGAQVYVKSVRVCYHNPDTVYPPKGYINAVAVYKNTQTWTEGMDGKDEAIAGHVAYLSDGTDRKLHEDCFTANATAPYKPVDGPSWITFNIQIGAIGDVVDLYNLAVTLTEESH